MHQGSIQYHERVNEDENWFCQRVIKLTDIKPT